MGLIFFNLMIFTVTLTALLLLVFGIIFAKNKDKSNPKRSNGVWPTVLGAITLPLFLGLDVYLLTQEAERGANVIGNGTLLLGTFFFWPVVLFVDLGVIFFYLFTGIYYIRLGKNKNAAIDHFVFGLLLVIFGALYIVSAFGATFFQPSLVG